MSVDSDPVCLVTGGGRGLGRSHVLELAAAGFRVVVNDTGSELDGSGGDPAVADAVVREVLEAGGTALRDVSDVSTPEGAEAVVRRATETYGRLDAVVHSAGILRDRTFARMGVEAFEDVLRVHLTATAAVTMAAWPALRASGAGRVVLTSSAGGIHGQFGQANYAAAKAGLVGLMNVLAQEGRRDGICVNAIAPVARTRMTEGLLSADELAGLGPEPVSRLVRHLCTSGCTRTGWLLEVAGGLVARTRFVSTGARPLGAAASADDVEDVLEQLESDAEFNCYDSSPEALDRFLAYARTAP